MIVTILLLLLVLLIVSCFLFFIFYLLLPSMYANRMNTFNPLFSDDEFTDYSSIEKIKDSGKKAVILCSEKKVGKGFNDSYSGLKDCSFYASLYDNKEGCFSGCVGLGSCVNQCPENAITIENHSAKIMQSCTGCGECVSVCPQNLIKIVDKAESMELTCPHSTLINGASSKECVKTDISEVGNQYSKSFDFWIKCYKMLNGSK